MKVQSGQRVIVTATADRPTVALWRSEGTLDLRAVGPQTGVVTDVSESLAAVELDNLDRTVLIDRSMDPRVKAVKSAEAELRSIHNFAKALAARGDSLWKEAMEEFDRTGESGYTEGHAAGFKAAAKLILDFIEFEPSN